MMNCGSTVPKYKVGDRVVYIGHVSDVYEWFGTVVRDQGDSRVVQVSWDKYPRPGDEDLMKFEDICHKNIWNSPLYKTLKEEI